MHGSFIVMFSDCFIHTEVRRYIASCDRDSSAWSKERST